MDIVQDGPEGTQATATTDETIMTDIVYVDGDLLIEGVRCNVAGLLEVTFNYAEPEDEPKVVHVRGKLLINGVLQEVEGNLEVSAEDDDQNWGDDPASDVYAEVVNPLTDDIPPSSDELSIANDEITSPFADLRDESGIPPEARDSYDNNGQNPMINPQEGDSES